MSKTLPKIGFDRYIDPYWMHIAAEVAIGETPRAELDARLDVDIKATEVRTKTKGILNRIWFNPNDATAGKIITEAAAAVLSGRGGHGALYVGVSCLAYPYFASVSDIVGRLFRLQGDCSTSEVHRRMFERFGKRSTVDQATSYVFKTLVGWDIIKRSGRTTILPAAQIINDPVTKVLVARALSHAQAAHAGSIAYLVGA